MTRADAFQDMVRVYRTRIAELHEITHARGGLRGRSKSDPSYALLLSPGTGNHPSYPWRVTSFRDGVPVGHRDYRALIGLGSCQDALAEFMTRDIEVV